MIEKFSPAGLSVTVSIGIACLAEVHHADFDRLYKSADEAVYQSKENGRNRVTLA
jgi:diguanylate cyclase (GGDEF)-like protein